MKRVVFLLLFFISVINCFGQFEDTASLNAFIRDTIKDRRPDKVTAAQLQKGMLGITQFLSPISVSYPVTYSDGQIGIGQATSTTNGYLNANDWSTFNNKLGGNLEDNMIITGNGYTLNFRNSNFIIEKENLTSPSNPLITLKDANPDGQSAFISFDDEGQGNLTFTSQSGKTLINSRLKIQDVDAGESSDQVLVINNGEVKKNPASNYGMAINSPVAGGSSGNLLWLGFQGKLRQNSLFAIDTFLIRLGIGIHNPTHTVHAVGDIYATTNGEFDGYVQTDTLQGGFVSNGNLTLSATTHPNRGKIIMSDSVRLDRITTGQATDSVLVIGADRIIRKVRPFRGDSIISRLIIMQPFQPAGTIEVTSGNDLVQGHSTKFLSEFNQGDTIQAAGQECVIMNIINDSVLYTIDLWASDYSGIFSISANTAPRFRFALNPNGNMGIGTSEPQDKLEIVGNNINGALSPAIRFTDNSGEGGYSRILYDRAEETLYFLHGASDGRFSFNRRVSINGDISAHNLDWGTWSPVISAETNVSGSTISECRYSLFGDVITISGVITLGTTTGNEASLEFDLPYFSAFINASDLSGSGSDVTLATPVHFSLSANTSNGNAKLNVKDIAGGTTGAKFSFTGQFIVLEEEVEAGE